MDMHEDFFETSVGARKLGDELPVLMWMTDAEGQCRWVNRTWVDFTGLELSCVASGRFDVIHEEDRAMVRAACELGAREHESIELEYRLQSRLGNYRWVLDRAVPRFETKGGYLGHVGVGVDITHQYEYRSRLQARRQALKQLHELNEKERAFYAGAVHDGLLQDVIGAEMLLQTLPHAEIHQLAEKTDQIRSALRSAIVHGRRLIGELRPMILDEQGLVSAVEYYARELENRGSISVRVLARLRSAELPKIWEGNVFRIIQEALNNVEAHSESDRADVRLEDRDGDLSVEIRDYGQGFDVDAAQSSFGVRRMIERAEIYGGTLAIDSSSNGTTVCLHMPIPNRSTND